MDALEFLKEKRRMCHSYEFCGECDNKCPLERSNNGHGVSCVYLEDDYPEDCIVIVEKWIKEHPIKE